jgi:hypothetical protein
VDRRYRDDTVRLGGYMTGEEAVAVVTILSTTS